MSLIYPNHIQIQKPRRLIGTQRPQILELQGSVWGLNWGNIANTKYVQTPIIAEVRGLSAITILQWIYPTVSANFFFSLGKGESFGIGVAATDTYRWSLRTTIGGTSGRSIAGVSLNQWQCMALRFNGSLCELLRDGISIDSVAGSGTTIITGPAASGVNDWFGLGVFRQNNNNFFYWRGMIGQTIIYANRALSNNEIKRLCDNRQLLAERQARLAYWRFKEGFDSANGTVIHDENGDHNATMQGFSGNPWVARGVR